jgi:hypothetical protein
MSLEFSAKVTLLQQCSAFFVLGSTTFEILTFVAHSKLR